MWFYFEHRSLYFINISPDTKIDTLVDVVFDVDFKVQRLKTKYCEKFSIHQCKSFEQKSKL